MNGDPEIPDGLPPLPGSRGEAIENLRNDIMMFEQGGDLLKKKIAINAVLFWHAFNHLVSVGFSSIQALEIIKIRGCHLS